MAPEKNGSSASTENKLSQTKNKNQKKSDSKDSPRLPGHWSDNVRTGCIIEAGPVTTFGTVMDAERNGGPLLQGTRHVLNNPTISELFQHCKNTLDAHKASKGERDDGGEDEGGSVNGKPFFGPQRPPVDKSKN